MGSSAKTPAALPPPPMLTPAASPDQTPEGLNASASTDIGLDARRNGIGATYNDYFAKKGDAATGKASKLG